MLRIFKHSNLHNEVHRNSCITLRFFSTGLEQVEKNIPKASTEKRFVRPEFSKPNKVLPDNFVINLFNGHFNKNVFQYPSIIRQENVEPLLKHSFEIEKISNKLESNTLLNGDIVRELAGAEALGLSLPQEYGGSDYSEAEVKFVQECAGVNFNVGKFLISNEVGCRIINKYGSEEQKKKYLPRLTSGESIITFAYLENAPLIDLKASNSSAVFDQRTNTFILHGHKKFVHSANVSDLILVFAKTSLYEEKESLTSKFSIFIVEKNLPGITVHQLKSTTAKDLDLFEINFEKVVVSEANMIKFDDCSSVILKNSLCFTESGTAVLCLSLVKKLINSITLQTKDKTILNVPLEKCDHALIILGKLSAYAYALESVVYFSAGRCDTFVENEGMFYESVIAKIFAVNTLKLAIDTYVQLLGTNCFKSEQILNEAFKVLQYATSLNENIIYLKLFLAIEGVLEASKNLAPTIKKIKKPDENPIDYIKFMFRPDKRSIMKKTYNLKNELGALFSSSADSLETQLLKFEKVLKDNFLWYGALIVKEESQLSNIADVVVHLYACTAALARASNSYCYDLPNYQMDANLAKSYIEYASFELNNLNVQLEKFFLLNEVVRHVGESTFNDKQYPASHPLIKTY